VVGRGERVDEHVYMIMMVFGREGSQYLVVNQV